MISKSQFGLATLLCVFSLSSAAQSIIEGEVNQISRSVGKQVSNEDVDLRKAVKTGELVRGQLKVDDDAQTSALANRHDQYFYIYDGDVELLSDIDGDGYHHALNAIFDVDVDYDAATLYAKLYLSREGGPWIQYATTDLFNIFEDDSDDTYEVTTELIEGYAPGYYALLVEIYSLNHVGVVASEIFDHHNLGKDLMLEDLSRDDVFVFETVEVTTTHGAGSFSLLIWLLLVQVVIAARGILTLSPRKTIIRRKDTSGLRSFIKTVKTRLFSTR